MIPICGFCETEFSDARSCDCGERIVWSEIVRMSDRDYTLASARSDEARDIIADNADALEY